MYNIAMEDGELYHFGTLGMKWGVRHYQNEDGTLTPAGKERYGSKIESYKSGVEKKLGRMDTKVTKKQTEANKLYAKADKKANRMIFANPEKAGKLYNKADKYQRKVNKLEYEGKKYYEKQVKSMSKIDTSDSLTKSSIAIGEKFVNDVNTRSSMLYIKRTA